MASVLGSPTSSMRSMNPSQWTTACADGKVSEISRLYKENPGVAMSLDVKGRTGLSLASRRGHSEAVKFLIPLSDIGATDNDGLTALHHSIFSFNSEVVDSLLKAGGDPKAKDVRKASPLALAFEHKRQNRGGTAMFFIVQLLEAAVEARKGTAPPLEASIPPTPVPTLPPLTPSTKTSDSATFTPAPPLKALATTPIPSSSKAPAQPDVSKPSVIPPSPSTTTITNTTTPARAPASSAKATPMVTPLALPPTPSAAASGGPPPSPKAPSPTTESGKALSVFFTKCKEGDLMAVVISLSSNPKLAISVDSLGCPALMAAARGGSAPVCRALLGKGADVNARNSEGSSALTLSIRSGGGHIDVVNTLLAAGADIQQKDSNGLTSLHHAVLSKNVPILTLLLTCAAELEKGKVMWEYLSSQDRNGKSALALATLRQSQGVPPSMITLLRDGESIAFLASCGLGDEARVKSSLTETPSLASCVEPGTGFSPLIHAVMGHSIACCELLIAAGAEVNGRCLSGRTALAVAAKLALPNMVQWLLDHGAKVSLADIDGLTPLHYAAKSMAPNPSSTIKILLKAGAKDRICNAGKTAFDYAQVMRNVKIHVTDDAMKALAKKGK